MLFQDLPLYQAIAEVFVSVSQPRSTSWITKHQRDLYLEIVNHMTDFSEGVSWKLSEVIDAWENYGKSASVSDGKKKLQLICEVVAVHGDRCFYANRGVGNCTDEIDLDRIIPGGDYSIENCHIACSFHNRSRGDKSIEEYLRSVTA